MEHLIYTAIADQLMSQASKDYMDAQSLPQIKSVALFNNQYRYEKQEIAYPLPAVFVEFGAAVYEPQGRETEDVDDRIRIHIEQKNFASTEYNSHNKAIALEVLKVVAAVHVIMVRTVIPGVGKLYRVGRELDTDHGNAPVHIYEYAIQYLDCSTDKLADYDETTADSVDLGLTKQLVDHIGLPDTDDDRYVID
ncbi:hypothetical protein [Reichenbachiella sp.]|uniref:hypothetical protein n=1 Tax=Reichenbachiella sp. TaxID=2184521 RepID=UPI003B5AA85B